jgi:hypothetical protein
VGFYGFSVGFYTQPNHSNSNTITTTHVIYYKYDNIRYKKWFSYKLLYYNIVYLYMIYYSLHFRWPIRCF